jgi:hypothetical protein
MYCIDMFNSKEVNMETKFNYWIMQEPKKNALRSDFTMIARYSDYDEAKIRMLRELAKGKRSYIRSVKLQSIK